MELFSARTTTSKTLSSISVSSVLTPGQPTRAVKAPASGGPLRAIGLDRPGFLQVSEDRETDGLCSDSSSQSHPRQDHPHHTPAIVLNGTVLLRPTGTISLRP